MHPARSPGVSTNHRAKHRPAIRGPFPLRRVRERATAGAGVAHGQDGSGSPLALGHNPRGSVPGARCEGGGIRHGASVTPILTLATHACLLHRMTAYVCPVRAERPAHGPCTCPVRAAAGTTPTGSPAPPRSTPPDARRPAPARAHRRGTVADRPAHRDQAGPPLVPRWSTALGSTTSPDDAPPRPN